MASPNDGNHPRRIWHWNWATLFFGLGLSAILATLIATHPNYEEDLLFPFQLSGLYSLFFFFYLGILTKRIEKDYPAEHIRDWSRSRRNALLGLALAGVPTTFFFIYGLIRNDWEFKALAFFSLFTLDFISWIAYVSRETSISMMLYFESPVSGSSPWSKVMARYCAQLDELALQAGVPPLSAFGFTDDWPHFKPDVIKHDPALALKTLDALIPRIADSPIPQTEVATLSDDLKSMRNRLCEAVQNGTRFCFILHSNGTNHMEWQQRKGFF